ncbi:unnamed protein product [Cyprideis torosa]|uniref:Large ribosomal subunit protein bL34m n=1 Tax=Cyprideis torosa TaxID=163714 RepID=A0A7R8WVZ0_9CRUS|nr:unnamed protein product [Cyprideis torosa]CAG0910470.1 unnamed protein product [Cyprideis torosa]
MKRTFQPSNLKRARTHGFRARTATVGGRRVINARRAKGRAREVSSTAFPREVRLINKREYQQVFSNAQSVRNQYFTVLVCPTEGTTARLGMVVAKKKAKRAVDRHRIKRLVRESFRRSRMTLPNVDIIVLSQASATRASSEQIFESLSHVWRKTRRLSHEKGNVRKPAVS